MSVDRRLFHAVREIGPVLAVLLVALLGAPAAAWAEDPPPEAEGPAAAGEDREDPAEEEEEEEPRDEQGSDDPFPDALRDPIIGKFIKRRVLIDRPGFSVEIGGRIQVQYYDADPNDLDNEDDLFLRRVRPYFLGHIGQSWTWKAEVEIGADIEAGSIKLDQLDVRDLYFRYDGFETPSMRLTLGNQKAPFSRDFLAPNTHLLLIERTAAGQPNTGVPGRVLGAVFRGAVHGGKLAYWASAGILGHNPDFDRLRFETLIFSGSNLNQGVLLSARMDLQPRGPVTFSDSDSHSPELRYTWSLAGYAWENDGSSNSFTEDGVSIDPERADLDSASGLEVSGGLRGRGITLDWEYNRIRGDAVDRGFTGGIYASGEADLEVAAVEGAYWIPRSVVELGGALSRLEADTYADTWDTATGVLNLHLNEQINTKLQITYSWISNRRGDPDDDIEEARVQLQYVW